MHCKEWAFAVINCCLLYAATGLITSEQQAWTFLQEYNNILEKETHDYTVADWTYYTNITDYNSEASTNASLKFSEFQKVAAKNASKYDWHHFNDPNVKRQFKKITDIGTSAYNDTATLKKISDLQSKMNGIYSKGEVCLKGKGCLKLEPGLTDIVTNSRDYNELLAVWKGWRDASGKKMRNTYTEFVKEANKAVKAGGYSDMGEMWRSAYETDTFEDDVQRLYQEIRPLYEQVHAYVRKRLREHYGRLVFPDSGHIPAHLLGNMWSQEWTNIFELVKPYPKAPSLEITNRMKQQNYNVTHMFRVAEEFFKSIGFASLPDEFWRNSMLQRPEGRDVVCHASAWDLFNGTDFRIKMCTTVTEESIQTVHHEMGHVYYFMTYMTQPPIYREGANPGFHEGMADIIGLSFRTPEHLKAIGLLDTVVNSQENDINFLLRTALDKIAFLPFGYLIDHWRWNVFSGKTKPNTYNADWWKMRCGYQGISPPVERSENDFDPGAKYHVADNTPYIRYFVSFLVQFQWHKALCDEIGYTGPLHRCDVYRNRKAGDLLKKMLKMGSSKPWQDAMQAITGQRNMSAKPVLDYFKPLMGWLQEANKEENIGWSENCPSKIPPPPTPEPTCATSNVNSAGKMPVPFALLLVLSLIALLLKK